MACIPVPADPYPLTIDVWTDRPERGKHLRYTISVETEENLEIIICMANYIPGYGWSEWKEIWEGYLPKRSFTFEDTLYIPEDAETGSVVIWVCVYYTSDEFYGVKKGRQYYLSYDIVRIAGHLPDPEVNYWKNQTGYWMNRTNYWKGEYRNLENKYYDLEQEYNTLLVNYTDLERKYYVLKRKYDDLEWEYYALHAKYTKLQTEYDDLSNRYSDLESRYILLEQERNYIYIVLIVSLSTLISLVFVLGGYTYRLRKRLKSLVPSRAGEKLTTV